MPQPSSDLVPTLLTRLPPEVRLVIWKFYLDLLPEKCHAVVRSSRTRSGKLKPKTAPEELLPLMADRALFGTLAGFYYQSRTFAFRNSAAVTSFFFQDPPKSIKSVGRVTLGFDAGPRNHRVDHLSSLLTIAAARLDHLNRLCINLSWMECKELESYPKKREAMIRNLSYLMETGNPSPLLVLVSGERRYDPRSALTSEHPFIQELPPSWDVLLITIE